LKNMSAVLLVLQSMVTKNSPCYNDFGLWDFALSLEHTGDWESSVEQLMQEMDPNQMYRDETPLQAAAARGDVAAMRLLLSDDRVRKEVDKQNSKNETALMLASDSCHLEIIQLLIQHGARVNLFRQKRGNNAEKKLNCEAGPTPLVSMLASDYRRVPSCNDGDGDGAQMSKVMKVLEENGTALNTSDCDYRGWLLQLAFSHRDPRLLKIVLDAGSSPQDAVLPIVASMSRTSYEPGFLGEAAGLLLHAKMDPTHEYRPKKTLLSMAARYCRVEVVRDLLVPPTVLDNVTRSLSEKQNRVCSRNNASARLLEDGVKGS